MNAALVPGLLLLMAQSQGAPSFDAEIAGDILASSGAVPTPSCGHLFSVIHGAEAAFNSGVPELIAEHNLTMRPNSSRDIPIVRNTYLLKERVAGEQEIIQQLAPNCP